MKSLPIIDLAILSAIDVSPSSISELSAQLGRVFETTGFAYLINPPLTSTDEDVFELVKDFFKLSLEDKMAIAKTSIRKSNRNTYRGCVLQAWLLRLCPILSNLHLSLSLALDKRQFVNASFFPRSTKYQPSFRAISLHAFALRVYHD